MSARTQKWTPDVVKQLIDRVAAQVLATGRPDWPILAATFGTTMTGCRFAYERIAVLGNLAPSIPTLKKQYHSTHSPEAAVARIAEGEPARPSHLRDTPLPLTLDIPAPRFATPRSGGVTTALVYGDVHIPDQDEPTLEIVRHIAQTLQPEVLLCVGDLIDAYPISRFDHDPHRIENLQDEIDLARIHLAQMRSVAPNARFILLEGNHEDRLRRAIWGMVGEASALNKLTRFREAMTWPSLLGLDELHIEFYEYGKQSKADILPKWICKHGDVVRQYSAYTARGEMERYNSSGSSGHTHRLGEYHRRDRNGAHVWVETGCCCSLNPEYAADPNWQNGCVVLTFDNDTGAVGVETIKVVNGLAAWRGNVLRATA